MKNKTGFTLIEFLICLFLTACLLWGTIPQFLQHRKEKEIKQACTTIKQTLLLAREMALKNRKEFQTVIDQDRNTLYIQEAATKKVWGKEERLPPGTTISEISKSLSPLIFRPDGGLAGVSGSIVVQDQQGTQKKKITIYSITGRIKITDF
ncbi:MAG: prepilin-type N-terminal cleavage/methylation domain-containing protein [Candidatus Omnitrophota bacterium]